MNSRERYHFSYLVHHKTLSLHTALNKLQSLLHKWLKTLKFHNVSFTARVNVFPENIIN
jgi:hypothetical protein